MHMIKDSFKQGQLDGLCGIYAVINALRLLVRISRDECYELIYESVLVIEKKKPVSDFIIDGISVFDVSVIIRDIVCPQYDVTRTKPFHRRAQVSVDEYWDTLGQFMGSGEQRSVIMAIETHHWGHWTVVRRVTEKQLILYDSGQCKVVNRRHCSTSMLSSETPVLIYVSQTFFLKRCE